MILCSIYFFLLNIVVQNTKKLYNIVYQILCKFLNFKVYLLLKLMLLFINNVTKF